MFVATTLAITLEPHKRLKGEEIRTDIGIVQDVAKIIA